MRPENSSKCIMIVAGEASGDIHGAGLVRALRQLEPRLHVIGIGDEAMKRAGVRLLQRASRMAVVGITEVGVKIPVLIQSMTAAKRALKRLKPDLLVLIDFPDFNIHLAGYAKKVGVPVLYYISPQIWAWRSGRVKKIRRRVDHMAVILPFEEAYYKDSGIAVTFVGHPLMDDVCEQIPATASLSSEQVPTIGLVPGSRDREVARHLPVMAAAVQKISQEGKPPKVLVSQAASVEAGRIDAILESFPAARDWERVTGGVRPVLERSHLIVAASGTVTLEAAIYGTPMIIMYKTSPVSYWTGRMLIKVKYIGLANLIAGREVAPELIQGEATPDALADKILELLQDPEELDRIRSELQQVRRTLGGAGASHNTARIALKMIDRPRSPHHPTMDPG